MEVPMMTNTQTLPPPRDLARAWPPIPDAATPIPCEPGLSQPRESSGTGTRDVDRTSTRPDGAGAANGWAGRLLRTEGGTRGSRAEAVRFGAGLGLAAVYGLALGARGGGAALFVNALGTPAALLAVGAVGVPAFAIVLALLNAPIDGARLTEVTARAVATTGLVLAGLAPAALLFALTSSTQGAATATATLGLLLAGVLGLTQLLVGLQRAIASADDGTRFLALLASLGFGLFAIALAARVWSTTLPALALGGGAS
jgi:hypothetical protein